MLCVPEGARVIWSDCGELYSGLINTKHFFIVIYEFLAWLDLSGVGGFVKPADEEYLSSRRRLEAILNRDRKQAQR
jgi:hypothetical protein